MAQQGHQVAKSPEEVCPLMAGLRIPSVKLRSADDSEFDLAAAVKEQPAVVVFYRGGW